MELVQIYTDRVPNEFYSPEDRAKFGSSTDRQEDDAERLGHEGQPEHHGRQVGQVADDQPERHRQRGAEARAERAGDQRGDARAGDGGGDCERAAIG